MARIAVNEKTGEAVYFENGQWKPARIAENPEGKKVIFNGQEWKPFEQFTTVQPEQMGMRTATPETTVSGALQSVLRGSAPYAAAATAGTAFGGPVGGVAAPAALFGADVISKSLGYQSPVQSIQGLLTQLGVKEPQSETEKILQAVGEGAGSTLGTLGIGKMLTQSTNPLWQRVGAVLSEAPTTQVAAGGGAAGASEFARQEGAGTGAQIAAGLLGGLAGGAGAAQMSRIGTPAMSTVPEAAMSFENIKFQDFSRLRSSNNRADVKAANSVITAIKEGTGKDYKKVLQAWEQSGSPLSEVNIPQVTKLGQRAASFEKGGDIATNYFANQTRQTEQVSRKAISENVGDVPNFEQMVQNVVQKGQEQARPLYEAAFKSTGGSGAFVRPLEKQLVKEGSDIAKLQKELTGLRNKETMVLGREASQKYNVYAQSNINQEKRDLYQKINDVTNKIDEATYKKQQISDFLEVSRADVAAGKQVVWSPQIQTLLDNPSVKKHIGLAYQIQENLANARGGRANALDFGITGFDQAGDPILSKVPNLKMLDTIKRGLDVAIEGEVKQNGRQSQLGLSLQALRKSLVNEIDTVLGESHPYAQARKVSSDYLSVESAALKGKDFFKTTTGQINLDLKKMTALEKEAYKKGAAAAANEKIGKLLSEGQNPYPKIIGTSDDKNRWKQLLTPEEYTNLEKNLEGQNILYQTKKKVLASAGQRIQLNSDFGPGAEQLLAGSGPRSLIVRNVANFIRNRTTGFNDDMAQSVAEILFEPNPKQKAIIMKKVFESKTFTQQQIQNMKEMFVSVEKVLNKVPVSGQIQALQAPLNQPQQEGGQ